MVTNSEQRLDVMSMGRIGVDIYPLQPSVGLGEVSTFGKFLGGSPTNLAVACARYGRRAALISGVGDDPFGRYCTTELARLGVLADHVQVIDELNTPVTFCEVFPPDTFPLYFYRAPTAPDLQISADTLPRAAVNSATILWLSVTGLSAEPSFGAHRLAVLGRAAHALRESASSPATLRRHTILDLDYRADFWPSPATARAAIAEVLPFVTVAVGNLAECDVAVGESDPYRAAEALLEAGVQLAVVKQGPDGALAMTRDEIARIEATPVDVVNGLGAGDAFGGALCHGLLSGWEVGRILHTASAAGAVVATKLECSTAMPTEAEVAEVMARYGHIEPRTEKRSVWRTP